MNFIYPATFHEYFRVSIKTFDYIINIIQDDLRRYSNFRICVEPVEKSKFNKFIMNIIIKIINYI